MLFLSIIYVFMRDIPVSSSVRAGTGYCQNVRSMLYFLYTEDNNSYKEDSLL